MVVTNILNGTENQNTVKGLQILIEKTVFRKNFDVNFIAVERVMSRFQKFAADAANQKTTLRAIF